jgi:hypothetical protein
MKETNEFRIMLLFTVAVGWLFAYLVLAKLCPAMHDTTKFVTSLVWSVACALSIALVAGGSGRGRMG